MDDFEEEFQAKSPKKPHEPVPFDVYSVSEIDGSTDVQWFYSFQ
jgi:hypothetical protein